MFRLTLGLYIVLGFLLAGCAYISWQQTWYATSFMLVGATIVAVISAIRFAEKSVLSVGQFIEALKYHDFQQMPMRLPEGKLFTGIRSAMDDVRNTLQAIRWEHEEHYYTLQEVLRSINIGIIAIDTTEERNILWCSPPAERLLRSLNGTQLPPMQTFRDLQKLHAELARTSDTLAIGSSTLIRLASSDTAPSSSTRQLIVQKSSYYKQGREIILLLLHEASNALDAKELESWHHLSRILTHEIMNSLAPISSLAQTAGALLESVQERMQKVENDHEVENDHAENQNISSHHANTEDIYEDLQDALLAVKTIARRSTGLTGFIENYRSVTRLPQPQKQTLHVQEFLEHLRPLCLQTLRERLGEKADEATLQIRLPMQPEEPISLSADATMLEQVVLNLVANAADAIRSSESKVITITVGYTSALSGLYVGNTGLRHLEMTIHDTGAGIAPDAVAHIFVPFFTTKPNGSGIGLSLSRQIIRAHGGTLTVSSSSQQGTSFQIVLPIEG